MLDFLALDDRALIQATAALDPANDAPETKICNECGCEFTPAANHANRQQRCHDCAVSDNTHFAHSKHASKTIGVKQVHYVNSRKR